MKILVINNESAHTQELVHACRRNGKNEVDKINWHEFQPRSAEGYDVVVLTGSSRYSVRTRRSIYTSQSELILNSDIPIIGICAGFELICDVFGTPLSRQRKVIEGVFPLVSNISTNFLKTNYEYHVFERHKIIVKNVNHPLLPIAYSNDNIAIVKHESKSIFGLQFHPEVRKLGNNGLTIFYAILDRIITP